MNSSIQIELTWYSLTLREQGTTMAVQKLSKEHLGS